MSGWKTNITNSNHKHTSKLQVYVSEFWSKPQHIWLQISPGSKNRLNLSFYLEIQYFFSHIQIIWFYNVMSINNIIHIYNSTNHIKQVSKMCQGDECPNDKYTRPGWICRSIHRKHWCRAVPFILHRPGQVQYHMNSEHCYLSQPAQERNTSDGFCLAPWSVLHGFAQQCKEKLKANQQN